MMKKLLFLLFALVALTACQESIKDRAERDARETTAKRLPIRMNDQGTLILERISFDKTTLVWKEDFLLDVAATNVDWQMVREALLKELKNQPSYKPYLEHGFVFSYIYCDMSNPKDTVANITFTDKDYR